MGFEEIDLNQLDVEEESEGLPQIPKITMNLLLHSISQTANAVAQNTGDDVKAGDVLVYMLGGLTIVAEDHPEKMDAIVSADVLEVLRTQPFKDVTERIITSLEESGVRLDDEVSLNAPAMLVRK